MPKITQRGTSHDDSPLNGNTSDGEAPLEDSSVIESTWPEPQPLLSRLPPVDVFRLEMLPSVLRPWVQDIQQLMQVPLDCVAVGAVGMLSGAAVRRARVQPKSIDFSWQETLNLWCADVAESGDKKTARMQRTLRPLQKVQARWREEDAQRLAEYYQAVKQAKKDKTAKQDKTDDPGRPALRSLIVNDATPEALHDALRDNPAGLVSVHDELTGWLGDLQKAGREGERGFYLACWNGNTPHELKRIGRGTVTVPACCLSMIGAIQPRRLAAFLAGESGAVPLADDGLLQRFQLAVWTDRYTGYQYIDRLPDTKAEARVERIVETITGIDPNNPLILKFAPDAQQVFVEWFERLERRLESGADSGLMLQYLSKYRSLMPILAALFELCEWADEIAPSRLRRMLSLCVPSVGFVGCRPVSRTNAERAIEWCNYLETHHNRICSLTRSDQHIAFALGLRIQSGQLNGEFTPRLVVQKGWSQLKSTDAVKKACERLVASGWLRETVKQPSAEGGRPSVSYHINPRIKPDSQMGERIWTQ